MRAGGGAVPFGAVPCQCDIGGIHVGDSGLENVGAVPGEVGEVSGTDPSEVQRWLVGEAQENLMDVGELGSGQQQPLFVEGNQAGVEEGIELGGEQEAVEDVEAFGVGGAVGPWLGVAGAEQFRQMESGHGAGTAPVVHEGLAEEILADALLGQSQSLGGAGWFGFELGDFRGVLLGGVVGQGHRQFGGAAQKAAQLRLTSGLVAAFDPQVGIRAIQFCRRRAVREIHPPCAGAIGRRGNHRLRLVAGGEHDHALRRALAHVLPAVGVTGFFDEAAFEGVHGLLLRTNKTGFGHVAKSISTMTGYDLVRPSRTILLARWLRVGSFPAGNQ